MKIGNVNLANPYILAPMAGVTDLPFRLLCKEQGAGLLCMEMISAKALQYKNKNTKALLAIHTALWFRSKDHERDGENDRRSAVPDPGHQYGMSGSEGSTERRRFCTYEESEAGT